MEKKKKARDGLPKAPAPHPGASICIYNLCFLWCLISDHCRFVLGYVWEDTKFGDWILLGIRLLWLWSSDCKWAVIELQSTIRTWQLLFYCWWLHGAEALQSQGNAFISAEPFRWCVAPQPVAEKLPALQQVPC